MTSQMICCSLLLLIVIVQVSSFGTCPKNVDVKAKSFMPNRRFGTCSLKRDRCQFPYKCCLNKENQSLCVRPVVNRLSFSPTSLLPKATTVVPSTVTQTAPATMPAAQPTPAPRKLQNDAPEITQETDSCPKLSDYQTCDAQNRCVLGCPQYDSTYTICNNTANCQTNRVCCSDPCSDGSIHLCFPVKASSAPPAAPPSAPSAPLLDAPEEGGICPKGEPLACIGWTEVPGVPGTGLCTKDGECAKGRKCCKIDNCNDDTHYCVPQVDLSSLPKGCPAHQVNAFIMEGDGCKLSECIKGKMCCPIDTHGNTQEMKC